MKNTIRLSDRRRKEKQKETATTKNNNNNNNNNYKYMSAYTEMIYTYICIVCNMFNDNLLSDALIDYRFVIIILLLLIFYDYIR